jgi:2-polyprenyl-3-methyl-5-hydroxy-6-metoxy-1,4-benzoquinol methylase
MNNRQIFDNIYSKKIWNNGNSLIPLSGPGSSLQNTKECSEKLNEYIYTKCLNSVLDLGCGDLTWITLAPFFNDDDIIYTGVDVVSNLIDTHKLKYPSKTFICEDLVFYKNMKHSSVIILRDVIFHLKNEEILTIFENIKNKFEFLLITSCNNLTNLDTFDKYHFSQKNLHKPPFNKNYNYNVSIYEKAFDRNVYIYSHDNFYSN